MKAVTGYVDVDEALGRVKNWIEAMDRKQYAVIAVEDVRRLVLVLEKVPEGRMTSDD